METQKKVLWVIIGILLIAVIYTVFFRVSSNSTGNSVNTNGQIDTTGWTENEIMNYQMHGIVPARAQGQAASSASNGAGMVGGC